MARKAGAVSIFTIANELGISAATVSRVINNRTGVGEETRQAVMQLLRKYDFKVNYPQQHLIKIAVTMPAGGVTSYVAQALSGIYDYLPGRDIMAAAIVYDSRCNESLLRLIRDQQCAGVILLNSAEYSEVLPELASSGLPVIALDMAVDLPGMGYINNDSFGGAYDMTKYLLSMGHRKIGFLMRWGSHFDHQQRLAGYKQALADAGVDFQNEWLRCWDDNIKLSTIDSAREMFDDLLKDAPDVTAVMSINDQIALGVLYAARLRGMQVPEDISVAGFDGIDYGLYSYPTLSSVLNPVWDAGLMAIQEIHRYLESNGKSLLPKRRMPTSLLIRQSTGAAPDKKLP